IDSGSNLYYFTDSLTTCNIPAQDSSGNPVNQQFYCPSSEQTLSATNSGASGAQSNVTFYIANAQSVFNNNPTFLAFDNVGPPNSDAKGFDFRLPFFFGRFVFTAIENHNTAGGMGPYFAY